LGDKRKAAKAAKYGRDELIRQARALFGVSPDAAAGALSAEARDALTVNEARQIIKQFLNRKVS
jgi:hypothetical protein